MSACRSCGAKIAWAETVLGKATPMELADDGTWVIVEGMAVLQTEATADLPRYKSHFSSCPQAQQWRQRP